MMTAQTSTLYGWFNPVRLAGPIFDKELRGASRHRRSYILRSAYVGLLMAVMVYFQVVIARTRSASSGALQVSRMAEAGKQAVAVIVWFQFITGQLLALALFSGAIGTEIRQRSLDVLLVTPITSFQIVMGKFLSKVVQLGLLLAVSLPLLAAVRVFGGVPWDYVISSLCITLTASLFIGALSLWVSITQHQTHQVFATSISWCLLLWLGLTGVPAVLAYADWISPGMPRLIARLTIPFRLMAEQTTALFTSARVSIWPLHCLIMLAATIALLSLSIWRVRRSAIARIVARAGKHHAPLKGRTRSWPWRPAIRRVSGSPVVWKELRRPILSRRRRGWVNWLLLVIAIAAVAGSFGFLVAVGQDALAGLTYGVSYLLLLVFMINLTTSSAASIPREKEAHTWPILLATPLENREIVRGKAVGAVRRNLVLLMPIPLLIALTLLLNPDNSLMLESWHLFLVGGLFRTAGNVLFLVGTALCLGTYVKTSTAAVVATFVVYLGSRMTLPVPIFLAVGRFSGPAAMVTGGVLQGVVYAVLGWVMLCHATRRVRRNVFG